MAIYTNLTATTSGKHGMFESSRLKATDAGAIYDALVRDDSDNAIAVDNGTPIAIGEYTGNGLQERYATIATASDVIAVVGTPAVVKDAFTKNQSQEWNFYIAAGKDAKAYEVVADDIFAVADYQFTSGAIAVGATVVVDGTGAWKVVASTTTEKFVGKIHSIVTSNYGTMVRIQCVKNA